MPITFVGNSGAVLIGTAAGTLTPVLPAHQTGDLLVAIAGVDFSAGTQPVPGIADPSNWTFGAGKVSGAAPTDVQMGLWYRIAPSAGTTNPGFAIGGSTPVCMAAAAVFRGVDTASPVDVANNGSGTAGVGSPGPVTGFSPLTNDCLIIKGVYRCENWFSLNSVTPDNGLSWNQISTGNTTTSHDSALEWRYAIASGAPPAIGATTWNITDSLASFWGAMISFKPFVESFVPPANLIL